MQDLIWSLLRTSVEKYIYKHLNHIPATACSVILVTEKEVILSEQMIKARTTGYCSEINQSDLMVVMVDQYVYVTTVNSLVSRLQTILSMHLLLSQFNQSEQLCLSTAHQPRVSCCVTPAMNCEKKLLYSVVVRDNTFRGNAAVTVDGTQCPWSRPSGEKCPFFYNEQTFD